jgi:hypothetical protein
VKVGVYTEIDRVGLCRQAKWEGEKLSYPLSFLQVLLCVRGWMNVRGSRDDWKMIAAHTRVCFQVLGLLDSHCCGHLVEGYCRRAVLRGRQPLSSEDQCHEQNNSDDGEADHDGTQQMVHPAYCQYVKISLASSLTRIVYCRSPRSCCGQNCSE